MNVPNLCILLLGVKGMFINVRLLVSDVEFSCKVKMFVVIIG